MDYLWRENLQIQFTRLRFKCIPEICGCYTDVKFLDMSKNYNNTSLLTVPLLLRPRNELINFDLVDLVLKEKKKVSCLKKNGRAIGKL